jgi:hypothetical protein
MVKLESVRILVIEDEVKLATHLSRALETERLKPAVDQNGASSGLRDTGRQFSMRHYSLRWKLVT